MRALTIKRDPDPPQAAEAEALRRWGVARRETLLLDRLESLTGALERLVAALESWRAS